MRKVLLLSICCLLSACVASSQVSSSANGISFVHLNDTYRISAVEDGTAGGLGRVVTHLRKLKAAGKDVRLLHGGDFLYPSLESQLWDGQQMVDAFNTLAAIAPMTVVAGNHEFDRRTSEQLEAAMLASYFEWIGDNYTLATASADVNDMLKSRFTMQVGGKTVGIFALTLHADDGGNERSYLSIDKDYLAAAEAAIEAFEADGVDAIVGLTHLHMWQDREIAGLRARHPRFVFVAGGHEHEPEYEVLTTHSAAIVKGSSNARDIWQIDLHFDVDGAPSINAQEIVMDVSVAEDPAYQEVERKWRAALLQKFPFLEAKVGVATVPMDAREVTVRNSESSWGNFIADQMRGAFGEPSDLSFVNSGTLRLDDWIKGDILFEDIGRTFGFSSHLRHLNVTGAEFKTILEAGYRGFGPSKGYFPQVSGFRVCVDPSRAEYSRIVSIEVPVDGTWQTMDPAKDYSLVVPDFLYGGGDGYDIPNDRPASPPGSELKYRVLDAILNAQGAGQTVGQPITKENRRFHRLLEAKEPCFFGS